MNEKQLVEKLMLLKEIKPRKEWVFLAKSQIFAEPKVAEISAVKTLGIMDILPAFFFQRKLAYAFATLLFVIVGVVGFAQYTMPGDLLFSVKKISEQNQNPLQIAYNRSEDLVTIIKQNRTENIAPAVSELKASIADAAKNLVASLAQNDNKKSIKEIATEIKKIEDNQKQLQTLGIDISATDEAKDLNNALAPLVKDEITDLEKVTLTEEQQTILNEVKDLYDKGSYSDALEKILLISK